MSEQKTESYFISIALPTTFLQFDFLWQPYSICFQLHQVNEHKFVPVWDDGALVRYLVPVHVVN